jgi:hypothetical protein
MEKLKQHIINSVPLGIVLTVFAVILIPLLSGLHAENMKKIENNKQRILQTGERCASNATSIEVIKSDIRHIKEDMTDIKEAAKEAAIEARRTASESQRLMQQVLMELKKQSE